MWRWWESGIGGEFKVVVGAVKVRVFCCDARTMKLYYSGEREIWL